MRCNRRPERGESVYTKSQMRDVAICSLCHSLTFNLYYLLFKLNILIVLYASLGRTHCASVMAMGQKKI
ncbi:hypothetical protein T01_3197 [Trichinella spiralis]|uniref:Uncharacterized protein n=1 Tax=Trichinella spiralis TaxID=6334 RepID=A0A0V1AP13_TRISP|nr:hypothetical protein T01_3197 [Trichinella spiralis]